MTNKRLRSKKYPPGIDVNKIPTGCYFNSRSNFWYVSFFENDKRKTRRIAGQNATMAELWDAMKEPDIDTTSFKWLVDKFKESPQWSKLSKSSQKSHKNTHKIVSKIPSTNKAIMLPMTNRHQWRPQLVQKIIDRIDENNGTTTSHRAKQNLSRLFNWGVNRGYMDTNPATTVELAKLTPKQRLPDRVLVATLTGFAIDGAKRRAHTKGSVPHAIWKSLELTYLNRLRGIEARHLTDAHILEDGLLCERAKGSRTNITRWTPRLRFVVDQCIADRDAIWAKKSRPYPMKPEDRYLLVNNSGEQITLSGWQTVWRRFLNNAIAEQLMTKSQWFGLHDMKRRGTTDTQGTADEKLEATGHKSRRMLDIYDKSIPRVNTPE